MVNSRANVYYLPEGVGSVEMAMQSLGIGKVIEKTGIAHIKSAF